MLVSVVTLRNMMYQGRSQEDQVMYISHFVIVLPMLKYVGLHARFTLNPLNPCSNTQQPLVMRSGQSIVLCLSFDSKAVLSYKISRAHIINLLWWFLMINDWNKAAHVWHLKFTWEGTVLTTETNHHVHSVQCYDLVDAVCKLFPHVTSHGTQPISRKQVHLKNIPQPKLCWSRHSWMFDRRQILEEMKTSGKSLNEGHMWHGSSFASILNICNHGFSMEYSRLKCKLGKSCC